MSVRKILFGHISLGVLCLTIGVIFCGNGCNGQELERRFAYTMEDGSYGIIVIEYKPNSLVKENKKLGSYYYIVEYFPSAEVIAEGVRTTLTGFDAAIVRETVNQDEKGLSREKREEREDIWMEKKLKHGVVKIAFYDENGHSLINKIAHYAFSTEYITTFVPAASSDHIYEVNRIEDRLEWKGLFDESWLTFENFCDIASVKVEYIQ